jgi:NADH-quinone oxidoreductase subunit N
VNSYLLTQVPILVAFAALLLIGAFPLPARERITHFFCVAGIAGTAILLWLKLEVGSAYFGEAIRITSVGRVIAYLGLALCLIGVILSEDYLDKLRIRAVEWRMVVLAMALGIEHLALAGDLATLFIAFELVSIPSYILAGFNHHDGRANEAGMKYLVLGVFASALFLLGIAFLYGATGQIHLASIHESLSRAVNEGRAADLALAKISLALFAGSLFFKVGVAPFHSWLPEVYLGSNYASLAFIGGPAKVAIFGMLAMLLWGPFQPLYETWKPLLLLGAACCAIIGNLQAIAQTQVKRLLAYSAVANAGFLLLAFITGGRDTIILYLAAYGLTSMGAFAALMAFGTKTADIDELSDLLGLGKKHPLLASLFTFVLLSYAGIPLTAGFAAKFGVAFEFFKPGSMFGNTAVGVLVLSLVTSLISFYYYFKIVRALWMKPESSLDQELTVERDWKLSTVFALVLCVAAVLALGLTMKVPGI